MVTLVFPSEIAKKLKWVQSHIKDQVSDLRSNKAKDDRCMIGDFIEGQTLTLLCNFSGPSDGNDFRFDYEVGTEWSNDEGFKIELKESTATFKMLGSKYVGHLERNTRTYLDAGWKLHGIPIFDGYQTVQAMTR